MRKLIFMILAASLVMTSCEAEEIELPDGGMEEVDAEPVDGGGGEMGGSDAFSAVVDGEDFVYDELEVIVDLVMDEPVRLDLVARDDEGINAFHVILPVITLTEGPHVLTYTPTGAYFVEYLREGEDIFRPTNDPPNVMNIIEYNEAARFVKGNFSTKMRTESGAPYLDDVTGEFQFSF